MVWVICGGESCRGKWDDAANLFLSSTELRHFQELLSPHPPPPAPPSSVFHPRLLCLESASCLFKQPVWPQSSSGASFLFCGVFLQPTDLGAVHQPGLKCSYSIPPQRLWHQLHTQTRGCVKETHNYRRKEVEEVEKWPRRETWWGGGGRSPSFSFFFSCYEHKPT